MLLVFVLLAATIYFSAAYFGAKDQLSKSAASPAAGPDGPDKQQIIDEISKYLELPSETPTFGIVSDVSQLGGEEFFKNAKSGDVVFVFTRAERGLLYRPSTHKIIEYAKVSLTDAKPTQNH